MSNPVVDFVDGQQDCRDGIPHQADRGKDYDRGYAYEYEAEQVFTHRGLGK